MTKVEKEIKEDYEPMPILGYGKGKTSITTDDDTGDGEGENNFRETMIAQKFTPYQQDIVEDKVEELSPIQLALQQRDLMGGPRAFVAENVPIYDTNTTGTNSL